jgi:hypothetical protein
MWGTGVSPAAGTRRARLALWILVAVSGAWLVYRNWSGWFGGDDWFILLDRRVSPGPGQLGLFEAHYEHWTTAPILVFRALYAVFGVTNYWPYVVPLVAVHLAIVVLLWHVMVRAAIDPWLALGFTAVVAVPGVGFENLTNVWQIALISPLALGLGALLLLPERGRLGVRDVGASILLTIGMMCSGVGIVMLGVVGLVLLVRRGARVAIAVAVLPAAAYAWWYLAYGSDTQDVTTLSYRTVPGFVWDGLTDALGDVVRLRSLGVVIVLATFAWLVWQLTRRPITPTLLVPAVLACGAVVSLALTGWRRGTITVPALSRYAYITIVLVLPLVAAATDWSVRRVAQPNTKVVPVATGVLLLAVVTTQVRMFDRYVTSAEPEKRVEKAALLNTAALAREGHQFLNDHPLHVLEPQMTVAKVVALDEDGKLPSLDGLHEDDRYTVLARLDLSLAPTQIAGLTQNPDAVRLGKVRQARVVPVEGRPECVELQADKGARARLLTDGGAAVDIRGAGEVGLRVERVDGTVRGLAVYATLDPAADQVLNIGPIDGGAVVLTLPEGSTRLCGIS